MDKRIIIINGSAGVGKDTFVNLILKYVPTMNYSSVDEVKNIAKLIGWNGEKTEKDRKFLSDLKLLCTEYNDMPMISMWRKVTELYNSNNELLFLHIREPEEIKRAVKLFNAKTLLIKNKNVEHIISNMADAGVYNYHYDYEINNDGTIEDLECKAKDFIKVIEENE